MRRIPWLAVLLPLVLSLNAPVCIAKDEKSAIRELDRRVKAIEQKRKEENKRLKEIDLAISRAQAEVNAARERSGMIERKIREHKALISTYESELRHARRSLARKWAALYTGAYLDMADILSTRPEYAGYVEAVISHDMAELDAYRRTRQGLLEAKERLDRASREQDSAIRELDRTMDTLKEKHEEKARLLASLDKQKRDYESRIRSLMKKLQERPSALPNRGMAGRMGDLPWPVSGRIVHGFGISTESGYSRVSNGVDIEAPEGTPVRTVYPGRIVFYDTLPSFGNTMIIDHGGGLYTVYGYLQRALRANGETVAANDTVAVVGRSGDAAFPALHFEIRYKGKPQDPARWLSRKQ
ncbi:MAG TPA: peptidoglycan DD-metalloendopeptidase family protein [Deltaproteobacteria bacterium]|nr:peptidoglycan DD-metalloendopeptidase family protein [Deltaproteobacteria bacterium]